LQANEAELVIKINFKKTLFALILSTLAAVGCVILKPNIFNRMAATSKPLQLALGGPWISLHPGLQHTVWADIVLSNQFESLVGMDQRGLLSPLGAVAWSISDDLLTYEFQIDTSKRFQDGSNLTAADYKKAWERSLALAPEAANSSLLDVLYFVEGFDQFANKKNLSGIVAASTDRLVIHFSKPSRMALAHLVGNRFAVYKEGPSGPIGTGKYVITEINEKVLRLDPNPYVKDAQRLKQVMISIVPTEGIGEALEMDQIDGLAFGRGANLQSSVLNDTRYRIIPGPEATHHVVHVNGAPGKLLSNPDLRKAIQFLLLKKLNERTEALGDARLTKIESQVFLPMQAGRISDAEAKQLIDEGEKYIDELRKKTAKQPLVIRYLKPWQWVVDDLRAAGISIATQSGFVEYPELIKLIYKSTECDLLVAAFSVVDGDPDGLYHAIGKNGAILSPIIYRPEVGRLAEEGRGIVQQQDIKLHYQKLTKQILIDVPFVHLGFSRSVAVIKNDKVKVDEFILSRMNEGHVEIFQPK
jgi:ABC-type transport system substrate-binding protein